MFSPTGRFVTACIALASAVCATTLPRLVPSRRAGQLVSRGLDPLVPKQEAILSYSTAPHHPPAANVAFIAHPGIPILLLEDIEFVSEEIVCSSPQQNVRNLSVRFAFEDAFRAALDSWSTLDEFIVLTAHDGCNSYDDRGSWRTAAVVADTPRLTITLTVEPISMREVGRSFSVRYDHTGGSHDLLSRDEMEKRDVHSFDRVFTYAYNPTIDERLQLFPFKDLQVAESLIQQLDDANLNLTCVGCSLNTNVSLGLHFDVDIGDASCTVTNQSCFTLNQAAMNFTVQSMNLTAALEVALGKELSAAANYSIIRVPIAPALSIPNLIQLSPAIGLGVEFSLDVAAGINFTYGASGSIPSGAFASVSLIDSSGQFHPTVHADGWDGSGVDQIPFRVNDGQFTVTTGLSFAPFAEVPFTILDTGAVLRINQNLPLVSATASLHTSVTRTCDTVGPDDFESFGTAFLVGAGMEISTVAELLLEKGLFSDQNIPDSWGIKVFSHDLPLAPTLGVNTSTCFVLSDDGIHTNTTVNTTSAQVLNQVLPGVPAPTGTMYPAAIAVPTWDMAKIESYYSANGLLPTNVNYDQMTQATTVPTVIQAAISSAASEQAASATASAKSGAPANIVAGTGVRDAIVAFAVGLGAVLIWV